MSRSTVGPPAPTLASSLGRHYPFHPRILAKLRKEHRLSQAKFAARIGVTEDTYARWERGDVPPHDLMYAGILALVASWPPPARRSAKRRAS